MKRCDNGARAFGQTYANELRRRRPPCGDTWHLDEVVLTIRGKKHFLWRAVDQHGNVLDILIQSHRNKKAAKCFLRKLLKGLCYVPRVIITDKLKSYGAAKRDILPSVEHRQHKRLNNRAENSHQPTRLRERENAEIQIRRSCTTLSLGLWSHLWLCPTAEASPECKGVSWSFTREISGVE